MLYFWVFFPRYERQLLKKSYNDTINYLTHERSCCYSWKLQNILSSRYVIVYLKFLLILDMKINTKYPVTLKLLFYRTISYVIGSKAHVFLYFNISEIESQKRKKSLNTLPWWERKGTYGLITCFVKILTVIAHTWLCYRN